MLNLPVFLATIWPMCWPLFRPARYRASKSLPVREPNMTQKVQGELLTSFLKKVRRRDSTETSPCQEERASKICQLTLLCGKAILVHMHFSAETPSSSPLPLSTVTVNH